MNHLYEQLTALKLTGFRDALKKQLAQPGTYQELGFEERLSLLTAEELTCRENRKAERLIKHARFRLNAELSKLDYRNNRGLDRALIRSLSQGNWLTLKQNILLTGATGSGKTFLACALGHNACRQGYKVYYYRLKALMEQCYQGHADGRYSKLLTRLNNSDLLLLDDWGLEPLSSEQRSDLLEIVDLMYLQSFPVDYIKLDKGFVQMVGVDEISGHIVENVIELARRLGIDIIAEGIETKSQELFMTEKGSCYLQGYRYAPPLPAEQFIAEWVYNSRNQG
ncbi:TPA: ATP-binding protein [Escherichia coli]